MTGEPRFWVGTSWKMNKTLAESQAFAEALAREDNTRDERIQRFVIPPFTAVREVKAMLAATSVKLAHKTCTGLTKEPGPEKYRR